MDYKSTYAVLTGDLVKSSRLTSLASKSAMDQLKKSAVDFGNLHSGAIIGRMDTFRHDSWQLLLAQPELAFRSAVFLRAALRMESVATAKFDTRISIGIGEVETINNRRISDSRGLAFTYSGKGLDAMKDQRLALAFGTDSAMLWDGLRCGFLPLLDCIISDWSPKVSRAVYGALKGWTQEEILQIWPHDGRTGKRPTRQAVGSRLIRAHWRVIDSSLDWVEREVKQAYRVA